VLTTAARDVELAVQRGRLRSSTRARFQAVALLVREERARIQSAAISEARRGDQLKRLDGVATILARTAARDGSLLALLTDDGGLLPDTRPLLRELRLMAGIEAPPEAPDPPVAESAPSTVQRRVVPQSVVSRQLANPFLAPDFSAAAAAHRPRLLANWELIGPLLRSFESSSSGAPSCMALPSPTSLQVAGGRELMRHQAQVVSAAAAGHRTFLLADEPGLGKTAQALLAADAAHAYPLLAVVPNVVKTNWAHEAELWTPGRSATVVHGDGHTVDAFSDLVVVNYDVLHRHVGWLSTFGFRGMVIDEAHFIKNKSAQRSRAVLELSKRVAERTQRPLLMALTGTPLINDIEDFLSIWEFLGWIRNDEPGSDLMAALERNGLTPTEPGFSPAARAAVIDMGIVRRRKVDVAADIPARRIADMPVELEGALGRSILSAERALGRQDRPAEGPLQLHRHVGDPSGRDVGGDVDLASPDDAHVDDCGSGRGGEARLGRCQAVALERCHEIGARLVVADPAEELPDREEVLDVVDQRRAGQRHQQRPLGAFRDPLRQLQHGAGALGALVLDEVRLVDDHPAEAEGAEPAHMPVQYVVVDDDEVREGIDGVAVAVDDGGGPAGSPELGLVRPVGLDDVRDHREQRVGVCCVGREQRLCGLPKTRLVGEEECPVARRRRGNDLGLVPHELATARDLQRGRARQRHARRRPARGALERPQQRPDQLPVREQSRPVRRRRSREVGREERVGQLPGDHRLRHDPALHRRRRGLRHGRVGSFRRRLDAGHQAQLPQEGPGVGEQSAVVGEQGEQRPVPRGRARKDRGDAVEPLQLIPAPRLADRGGLDPGPLLTHEQGNGLEPGAGRRAQPAALHRQLDVARGGREHRDEPTRTSRPGRP
jgi:hypothetical protein